MLMKYPQTHPRFKYALTIFNKEAHIFSTPDLKAHDVMKFVNKRTTVK